MPASSTTAQTGAAAHSVGYTLGVIALTVSLLGLAVAYGVGMLAHSTALPSTTIVSRTLLGKQLQIPAGWLREAGGSAVGFASSVELTLSVPLVAGTTPARIGVTLLPQSQVQPSIAMLDGVYLHEFTQGELSGPPGLIGKPLNGGDGYAGETVWYDPLSATPFVAKCTTIPGATGPARCLRTVSLADGIAAVFSFDATALPGWKTFDPALEALLHQIGAV